MNIPFQITMVMTYGWFQRSFNPEKQYNPTIHACAGAFAGLFKDIFGQMLLDMFSFWHSKSKNFWKSLPKKLVKSNVSIVKLIHFHFTNFLTRIFFNFLVLRYLCSCLFTINIWTFKFAGGVASVVTMPWDVCKTLLNTQEPGVLNKIGQTEVRGLMNAAYIVWKTNRITGFYKGLTPRVLYQVRWDMSTLSWQFHQKYWKKRKLKIHNIFLHLFHGKNYISRLLQQLFLGACMKVSNICGWRICVMIQISKMIPMKLCRLWWHRIHEIFRTDRSAPGWVTWLPAEVILVIPKRSTSQDGIMWLLL